MTLSIKPTCMRLATSLFKFSVPHSGVAAHDKIFLEKLRLEGKCEFHFPAKKKLI